eukprot:3264052-Amphidinium_carterae.1
MARCPRHAQGLPLLVKVWMVVMGPLVPMPPKIIETPSRVLCIPFASQGCARCRRGNSVTSELKLGWRMGPSDSSENCWIECPRPKVAHLGRT